MPFQILNIASSRPVKLKYYLKLIEEKLVKKSVIRLLPLQKGDIRKTHGDTTEIVDFLLMVSFWVCLHECPLDCGISNSDISKSLRKFVPKDLIKASLNMFYKEHLKRNGFDD